MKRSKRLKPRSKKMAAKYVERRKLVEKLLKEHPQCEAQVPDVCTGKSVDLHELLARSQGGSILRRVEHHLRRVVHVTIYVHGKRSKASNRDGIKEKKI